MSWEHPYVRLILVARARLLGFGFWVAVCPILRRHAKLTPKVLAGLLLIG